MAFVLDVTKTVGTDGVSDTSITFADWFTADDELQAGDYIMVCASNQTGTATALDLTSATGSWTKLDGIDSPRVSTVMRSQIWWHKYDGTTLPSEPTASNGANAAWVAFAWVVRDAPSVADQSWIDVNARTDTTSNTRIHTIGSVTTTEADSLVLTVFTSGGATAFETPDNFWGVDLSVGRAGDNSAASNPIQRIIVASLDPEKLDLIYTNWGSQTFNGDNSTRGSMGFFNVKYNATPEVLAGRQSLIEQGWSVSDGGQV